jgi:hypothetical protein
MNSNYLSFLMGGGEIRDGELDSLGVSIEKKDKDGDRSLKIPEGKLGDYKELIRAKLTPGFWNEFIGEEEIVFIFKFKDGSIKEYKLSHENEKEIDDICADFNNEQKVENPNVYKMLSENKFYHDFMLEHYSGMINRKIEE